jgi:flagellar basal body-associated protein FliL
VLMRWWRKGGSMDLIWIIIIVLVVLALLGYFGFGRRRGL